MLIHFTPFPWCSDACKFPCSRKETCLKFHRFMKTWNSRTAKKTCPSLNSPTSCTCCSFSLFKVTNSGKNAQKKKLNATLGNNTRCSKKSCPFRSKLSCFWSLFNEAKKNANPGPPSHTRRFDRNADGSGGGRRRRRNRELS